MFKRGAFFYWADEGFIIYRVRCIRNNRVYTELFCTEDKKFVRVPYFIKTSNIFENIEFIEL
jgi:hypothetical protein